MNRNSVNSTIFFFHLCCNEIKSTPKLLNTHVHRRYLTRKTNCNDPQQKQKHKPEFLLASFIYFSVAVFMIRLDLRDSASLYCTYTSKVCVRASVRFVCIYPFENPFFRISMCICPEQASQSVRQTALHISHILR